MPPGSHGNLPIGVPKSSGGSTVKLTEKAVANLKSGKTDHIEFDENFPGFGIRIRGAGKTWIYQYAFGSGAKRVNARMTLGKWPALPAVKARSIAEDLHAKIRLGGHPAADKKVSRSEAGFTFGKLIDGYLEFKKGELRPKSYVEITRHLNVYAAPLHGLPVTAIDLRRIADLLDGVAKERGAISANRTQTTLGTLFTWAMRKGLAAANPVIAAEKRKERSRDRVLGDRELATVWNTLPEGDYGDIIRLLILCGARAAEIGSLRWNEIDLEHGLILLSGERVKNGRAFEIPLSEPMRAILQRRAQSKVGAFVFGRSGCTGFSGWGNSKERLDRAIAAKLGKAPESWVVHDLRRTTATRMADLGTPPHIVEQVLNHQSGHRAGVAGIYNRAMYKAEKAQALAQWGAHVVAVTEGKKSKITALKRA
jgi:integrase